MRLARVTHQTRLCETQRNLKLRRPSVLFVLDDDQVGISYVQRSAILGEFNFYNVLFASFSPETSDEFVDVLIFKFTRTPTWNRSLIDHVLAFPDCPVRSEQRIIAAAILRVAQT